MDIINLPDDTLLTILSQLGFKDKIILNRVCKRFKRLINKTDLFKPECGKLQIAANVIDSDTSTTFLIQQIFIKFHIRYHPIWDDEKLLNPVTNQNQRTWQLLERDEPAKILFLNPEGTFSHTVNTHLIKGCIKLALTTEQLFSIYNWEDYQCFLSAPIGATQIISYIERNKPDKESPNPFFNEENDPNKIFHSSQTERCILAFSNIAHIKLG